MTSHWVCVCVCVSQCNMCECRGCFIQETKSEDTYMQKTHSKLSVQNCFLCDIHVIEQVRASSYKSVRMTGTSIYWLITDSWKIRTFSGTKDLAVVSLNCPCWNKGIDKNEIIGAARYSIVHRVQLMITLIKMALLYSV